MKFIAILSVSLTGIYMNSPLLLPPLTPQRKLKDLYFMTRYITLEKIFVICFLADTHLNKEWFSIFSSFVYMNPVNLEDDEMKDPHHFSSLF